MKQSPKSEPTNQKLSPEPKKTTPPTSQKAKAAAAAGKHPNTSLPSSQKPAPRKRVRPLQTVPAKQRSYDDSLDEALDVAFDEFVETEAPLAEEIPVDAPEEVSRQPKPTNLLQRMKLRRQVQAEKKMNTMEVIRRRSGFSEDDIGMIFELGYESEFGRLVGYDNLKKLKYDHLHRMSRESNKRYRTAFGYCGQDSITPENRARSIAKYLYDRRFLILRTLLTALALMLVLVLDYPALFGGAYEAFDAEHPLLLPILSSLVMVGATALSYRQFNAGIRSYFKLSPTPYSTIAVILPITLLYNILAMAFQIPMLRINIVAVGSLLVLSLCDVFRLTSEMRVLEILTKDAPKTVLEPTEPRKKKLRQGKKLIKIINDDLDENFYHIHSAQLTAGFFRRFNSMGSAHAPFRVLLTLPIVLGFLAGFAVALTNGLADALNTFAAIVTLGTPCASCLGFFFPLCHANRLLTDNGSALLGEEAVAEYNESKTVIFNDYRLCLAQSCSQMAVRESDDLRRDLKLAGILFRKIGGSMEQIGKATATKVADPAVALVRIADTGVEAVIDTQYHVIAGDASFLKKSGIRIPRETADRALNRAANVGVMYVAVDGLLKLTYDIEYALDPRFEVVAERLADPLTSIAIQSYNPNLHEEFLGQIRYADAVPVRVMKPGKYESLAILDISDTGAVALGGEDGIVNPLYAAKKVFSATRISHVLQLIAASVGCVGTLILFLLSMQSYLTPIVFGLYSLAWTITSAIVSLVLVNRHTLYLVHKK